MNTITVISTYAIDIVTDAGTGVTTKKAGGPALWIEQYFKSCNQAVKLHSGPEQACVAITVADGDESGAIVSVSAIPPMDQSKKIADLFLVSTIADEYDLHDLSTVTGLVALDVQGYVRSGFFNSVTEQSDAICETFDIIKMTEAESKNIPQSIVRNFNKKICIVTKGAHGFSLFENSVEIIFESTKVDTPDTIGAGDTFFAAFCSAYLKSRNAHNSAILAKEAVEIFLRSK